MGVSYIYKKIPPQDKAIIPFNAHKQYNFTSASATTNKIAHFNTSYTSESISSYSSSSSDYGGDTKNVIKYNQIDHLFYRDHLKKFGNKKDPTNYLKQRRELYKEANILSIPSGLYGFEIKKTSFYLSSSTFEIYDDSYGNLILSGTNLDNYPNNVQENVFRLDPIKGFKKHDLAVHDDYAFVEGREFKGPFQYIYKQFYRQGRHKPGAPGFYTSNNERYPKGYYSKDEDDSYFFNSLKYSNIDFVTSSLWGGDSLRFRSNTSSFIESPHNARFNFNVNKDFAISFYIHPLSTASGGDLSNTEKRYILSKSTTKTRVADKTQIGSGSALVNSLAGPQYPFEIYMQSQSLYFARSDGDTTFTVKGEITASEGTCQKESHILCQVTGSEMQLWFDGTKIDSKLSTFKQPTRNKANLYIGSKGKPDNTMLDGTGTSNVRNFNGTLNNLNIYSKAFNQTQIQNISSSINASPYVGNIFYQSGFAVITNPKYLTAISGTTGAGIINTLQFQGTHLIYENEYQCTVQEHEFNYTTNSSVRKQKSKNPYELESFTSSSFFKPYVTTIGLYNEAYELLAIGKLGQPIRMSDETDTTFIVRWDS